MVNHRLNFVDPLDPEIHTPRIEGSSEMVKHGYRAMYGTSDNLFLSHLQEFLWRRVIGELFRKFAVLNNPLLSFLKLIKK